MVAQIKAILLDIGGVLWHPNNTPLSEKWALRCGLSAEAFDQIVYCSEWSSQSLVGRISGDEMWKNIGRQLGLLPAEIGECQNEYWAGVWDIDLLDYCRTLKPQYKLGIISDAESDARKRVKSWVNEELFDVIVFSSEVGVCKPDSRIFQYAFDQLGIKPTEAVFLDDRKENIIGAQALGMHAILYENRDQAIGALRKYVKVE